MKEDCNAEEATFGEFNMKIDGLNKEYSALVLAQISGQKTEEGK